ncbi:hypothetical protein KCU93_g200, partial [Aureobasidium melanogenum]
LVGGGVGGLRWPRAVLVPGESGFAFLHYQYATGVGDIVQGQLCAAEKMGSNGVSRSSSPPSSSSQAMYLARATICMHLIKRIAQRRHAPRRLLDSRRDRHTTLSCFFVMWLKINVFRDRTNEFSLGDGLHHIPDSPLLHPSLRFHAPCTHVRHQDTSRIANETFVYLRLFLKHIQTAGSHMARVQGFDQCILVHHGSASCVHNDDPLLHLCEFGGRNNMTRLGLSQISEPHPSSLSDYDRSRPYQECPRSCPEDHDQEQEEEHSRISCAIVGNGRNIRDQKWWVSSSAG